MLRKSEPCGLRSERGNKEMKANRIYPGLLMLTVVLFSVNTANAEIFKKAEPTAQNTDFIEGSLLRPRGDVPFNRVWKASKFDKGDFSEIYIAPVNTDYVRQSSWWSELNVQEVEDDLDELAASFRSKIRRAFWNAPYNRFKVVNKPGPKTLIFELAITELIPNKAGYEVLLTAAGPAAGSLAATAGAGAAKTVGSKSTIAIEARIRDGGDGAIVGMFSDREYEKGSIINIRNFSWYGQIELIMDEWAEQFVKVANKSPRDIVADTPTFSFKPW